MSKLPKVKLPTIDTEQATLGLLVVGLPLIGFVWFGWRAALTVLILTLIGIGLTKLRYS